MAISLTRHAHLSRDILGAQEGDAISVATGQVSDALAGGFYRIKATDDCIVRIGSGLEDATDGERWDSGDTEVRVITEGQVIAVDAVE